MSKSLGVLFGPSGHVSIIIESGNLWKNMGYTYCGDEGSGVQLGPSRRCLNPLEAMFLVQKDALALTDGIIDRTNAEKCEYFQAHVALQALLPHTDMRCLEVYDELRSRGFVVRFPSEQQSVLEVFYTPSMFRFSVRALPDATIDVYRDTDVISFCTQPCESRARDHIVAAAGVSECVFVRIEEGFTPRPVIPVPAGADPAAVTH